MKRILFGAIVLLSSAMVYAQSAETYVDNRGTKIIKGFMTKQQLASDTAFAWFAQNQQGYTPEQNALQAFKANKIQSILLHLEVPGAVILKTCCQSFLP